MVSDITQKVRDVGAKGAQTYGQEAQKFGERVRTGAEERARSTRGLASDFGAGYTGEQQERLQRGVRGIYEGPGVSQFQGEQGMQQMARASKLAELAKTGAGRGTLLREVFDQPGRRASAGEHRLDRFFMGQAPAQEQLRGMSGEIEALRAGAQHSGQEQVKGAIQQAQDQAKQEAQALRGILERKRGDIRSDVAGQLTDLQGQYRDVMATRREEIAQSFEDAGRPEMAASIRDPRTDISSFVTGPEATGRFGGGPQDVAAARTPEQVQQLNALARLIGGPEVQAAAAPWQGPEIQQQAITDYVNRLQAEDEARRDRLAKLPSPREQAIQRAIEIQRDPAKAVEHPDFKRWAAQQEQQAQERQLAEMAARGERGTKRGRGQEKSSFKTQRR
jgi:hypothetical protein